MGLREKDWRAAVAASDRRVKLNGMSDIDPLNITPIIASQLKVATHQVTGSIENNGDELHVSVSLPGIPDSAIQEVARVLGGTVLEVDIERDRSKTDFTVHDSTVVKQRLAEPS